MVRNCARRAKAKATAEHVGFVGETSHVQRACPKANDANIIAALKGKGKGNENTGKYGKQVITMEVMAKARVIGIVHF